ncbi:MAG: class I SAM-dependent methyltransferase [Proteobacteria bacterium]|nr:class I SAM-dependent methyltransferase [Pseudomonadota bacterium]MDA0967691.1 class I SAM-dependent methyltransferase [Pseudomonadota bacterium]
MSVQLIEEKLLSHFFRRVRKKYANRLLEQKKVLSGEYCGMRLPDKSIFANFSYAQVLGTYELFLQTIIAKNIEKYEKFIDIGCGCGYYTNGVAFKYKKPTLGIDLSENEIDFAKNVSKLNELDKYTEHFKRAANQSDIQDKAFHLIDIEGGEWELLKNLDSSKYKNAAFVVELHKTQNADISDLKEYVTKIFKKTHKVTFETESPILINEQAYNEAKKININRKFAFMLTNEMRAYFQEWALILPKS